MTEISDEMIREERVWWIWQESSYLD